MIGADLAPARNFESAHESASAMPGCIPYLARRARTLKLMFLAIFGFLDTTTLWAYSPTDPVVLAMVDRGVAFLERSDQSRLTGEFEGGRILVGYTIYKVTGDKDHPLVKAAVQVALRSIDGASKGGAHKVVYDVSIAAVFLSDLDPVLYRPQLVSVREFYRYAQKKHGGFGYLTNETGDTSQVQYVMLAMWAMQKSEVEIPPELIESTMRYLLATQDPNGGWGYQGVLPSGGQLVAQGTVTKSLSTAGIGAVLVGADSLGILGKRIVIEDDPDIPKAFTRIDLAQKERQKVKNSGVTMKLDDIAIPIGRANNYQKQNPFATAGKDWMFYYRYSEERYESFLEIMTGDRDRSPAWYNAGVTDLKRLQDNQGAWGTLTTDFCPPDVCTAFAILYLIRSTQKTIAKLNEGLMAGGYGLPTNGATIKRVGDRIVSEETASVDGLLEMMEKNKLDNVEESLLPEDLVLAKDPAIRKAQVARLARLLSSRDYKARRIAAKLLGRSDDIHQVPELIFALTDGDPKVPVLAEESLRLLTRKLTVRMVNTESTPQQKLEAAKYWRNWYSSMRPDYIFLDR